MSRLEIEQALRDCMDYLSMGGLSANLKHNLIREVLVDANTRYLQAIHQDRMNIAQGLPSLPDPLLEEKEGVSQLFHWCHNRIIKSNKPSTKIKEIGDALFYSPLFKEYKSTDDFEKSRRNKQAKIELDLSELEPPEPSFHVPQGKLPY